MVLALAPDSEHMYTPEDSCGYPFYRLFTGGLSVKSRATNEEFNDVYVEVTDSSFPSGHHPLIYNANMPDLLEHTMKLAWRNNFRGFMSIDGFPCLPNATFAVCFRSTRCLRTGRPGAPFVVDSEDEPSALFPPAATAPPALFPPAATAPQKCEPVFAPVPAVAAQLPWDVKLRMLMDDAYAKKPSAS